MVPAITLRCPDNLLAIFHIVSVFLGAVFYEGWTRFFNQRLYFSVIGIDF
jgi:hypothetical protein